LTVKHTDTAEPGAPLLIGVIGKRDLNGAAAKVREAFDAAFDLLDRRLPCTPKILLSALATGADTVAAEAALARKGWRVIAPLPFAREVYETDFTDPADLARLQSLLAHPRVRVMELAPLRRPGGEARYAPADLVRTADSPPDRTLHYEQAGLYIAERSAVLISLGDPDEAPERIGGTARTLKWRLQGPDPVVNAMRARSADLLHEKELEEPRVGPVWRIRLRPEDALGGERLALTVELPGEGADHPLGANHTTEVSLAFARGLEAFNRLVGRFAPRALTGAAPDAVARLRELRAGLSAVQGEMKARVQRSVWMIAAVFFLAIFSLEAHIALDAYAWADWLSTAYFLCILTAVGLYALAVGRRWQPIAEDYRAISEALRVQIVLWQSGLDGRDHRVDLRFLHGAEASLGMVRQTVGQFIEAARLWTPPPPPNPDAAADWIKAQIRYFDAKIGQHSAAVARVQCASWFLFLAGLAASACVGAMPVQSLKTPFVLTAAAEWPATGRAVALGLAALVGVGLYFVALRLRALIDALTYRQRGRRRLFRVLDILCALAAGVILALALCDVSALLPFPGLGHGGELESGAWREHQAEKLMLMGAVLTTALAGAIRFVADKLSWEAELQGYEQAHAYFHRAKRNLDALTGEDAPARRQALILELVDLALQEDEAWLTAHRERPLEPLLGG
jgi:hypothetical protein